MGYEARISVVEGRETVPCAMAFTLPYSSRIVHDRNFATARVLAQTMWVSINLSVHVQWYSFSIRVHGSHTHSFQEIEAIP
jgi:hypothetical protein